MKKIDTIEHLEDLWIRYENFSLSDFKKNVMYKLGVDEIKNLSEKLVEDVYKNYYRNTFFKFSLILRDLWFYSDYFKIFKKYEFDIETIIRMLKFLKKEKLVEIKKNKIKFLQAFPPIFTKPIREEEVIKFFKRKLGSISLEKSVLENFGEKHDWKEKYDQLPIDFNLAVFIARKILDYYPFRDRFLFVGADDFVYLIIGLIDPKMSLTVIDIDEDLISKTKKITDKFDLTINFDKADIRRDKIEKKFFGAFLNPPYTYQGVLKFLKFSSNQIDDKGGVCFLVLGDESIGNRVLFLQREMNKMNLIIREISDRKIYYGFQDVYQEDIRWKKLSDEIGLKLKKRDPYISASLCVLEKLPCKPKKIKIEGEIYSYL
ncbi:MAG: bis-aminopropyl spermidine synthase family protein [Candidatus Aenigmarchaeota archaeon]|nr:bis-aminopropyl spermidine synthase family protein [Candidatus Aenigmarchaeota archaeon]MCX8190709.1 bis-aminopropyl spermidine synthase family protein [Candidatus Aenigmarchaeota archaeon]MDW8159958.1 bis-aminopropyl spermidine synthase family protein [Candidatus Aenigmarchaeota archaeon]